jgi:hypothetical protein
MDTAGLHVPTKPIRGLSALNVGNISRLSPSTRCGTAANSICKPLDVFIKHNISLEGTFSLLNPTELRHYRVACIVLLPSIKFKCRSSSSFSFNSSFRLASIKYTFNACYRPLALGKHLHKGIELN